MSTINLESYSVSPSYVKYSKYLYNNKKTKAINRKPIFAPILEEPSNIVQNLQELNTSSIPITNNNNNNSSFENSINGTYMADYHTMNKFRPSLNLSCLPPVFEIPRKQVADSNNNLNSNMLLANNKSLYNDKNKNNNNNNNKLMMRNARLNLRPIINNNNLNANSNININVFNNTAGGVNNNNINSNKSNFVSLPPINSHTNYSNIYNNNLNKINNNNINYNSNKASNKNNNNSTYNIRNYNQRKRQYLKPIQFKNSPNPSSYNINNETKRTIDAEKQGGSYGKNQGKYYYNLNNKNIIKSEKLKEERALRRKEMSNISLNQNKNYVDRNIVINFNNKINHTTTNNINLTNNTNIEEFVEINRNKNRVIHIPTLKIYDRFDISFKNWNLYEKYVKNWTKMMRGGLEIKAVIENNELNCFNIIIERSKNCSLGDLLRSVGSMNEYIIMSISKQIIPLIKKYNGIFDYRENDINERIFNYIDIDNIWFNEQYNVLLYPGKFKYYNKNENLLNFFNKIFEAKTNQINIDLMNFGITLINMNIFILDISVDDLFQLIKKGEEEIGDICCLFHYFCKKIKFISNFYESFKSNNSNSEFNQNYFDFLHTLTIFKRNDDEKNIIDKISEHPFITNSSVVNENTNINELIKLSKKYDFSNEYYTSNSNIISFDLITRNIRKKLSNFEYFFTQHNIYDTKTLFSIYNIEIEELCRELRVNEEELHDKLLIFYENLLENKENNY